MTNLNYRVRSLRFSDYLGLVESFARAVGIARDDRRLGHQQGPAFPARYRNSVNDPDGDAATEEVSELWFDNDGDVSCVAPAVICGLQGVWNFDRKIESCKSLPPAVLTAVLQIFALG